MSTASPLLPDLGQWTTLGDCLEGVVQALERADIYFGHGANDAREEGVELVLACFQLDPASSADVLEQALPSADDPRVERLLSLLERRITEQIPLAYLLGEGWFAGLRFKSDARALVPRSPIAEMILNGFQPWLGIEPTRILDLCCGGGSIGITAWHAFPEAQVDLADIDEDALALCAENVDLHMAADNVRILQGDLLQPCAGKTYDLILCNPPYVDAEDMDSLPAEYLHEPQHALAAGPDGLDLVRKLLAQAARYLSPEGLLVVEVGNSWSALEQAFPAVAFTWVELEFGGHGVLVITREELEFYRESWA